MGNQLLTSHGNINKNLISIALAGRDLKDHLSSNPLPLAITAVELKYPEM